MNFEPTRWGHATAQGQLPEAAWRWLADRLGMPALLATPARAARDIVLPPSRLTDAAREKFIALLGSDQVRGDAAIRIQHVGDGSLRDALRRRAGEMAHAPDAVLFPRTESEAVAVLRACADLGICIGGEAPRPRVALDLTHMTRLDHDAMSGLVSVEAGIASADLARRLALRGQAWDGPDFASLGSFIAAHRDVNGLHAVRLATPLGLAEDLRDLACGAHGAFGIVTGASLRVHPLPVMAQTRHYLFPDFAAGLAALHQAAKGGVMFSGAALSDAGATSFARGLTRAGHPFNLLSRLRDIHLEVRHFDDRASALVISFPSNKARKAFDALVKRLGGMRLYGEMPAPDLKPLADRGVNAETFHASVRWSRLPALYAQARHALDQAMRLNVPRPGAHGLVLAEVTDVRPDGAALRLTAIYPRKLEDAMVQADAVHKAGTDALATAIDAPSRAARAAAKQALDPKNILPPL